MFKNGQIVLYMPSALQGADGSGGPGFFGYGEEDCELRGNKVMLSIDDTDHTNVGKRYVYGTFLTGPRTNRDGYFAIKCLKVSNSFIVDSAVNKPDIE